MILVLYSLESEKNPAAYQRFRQQVEKAGWRVVRGNRGGTVNPRLVAAADLVCIQDTFPRLAYEANQVRQRAREAHKPLIYDSGEIQWGAPATYPDPPVGTASETMLAMMNAMLLSDAVTTPHTAEVDDLRAFNRRVYLRPEFFEQAAPSLVTSREPKLPTPLRLAETGWLALRSRLMPWGSVPERLWLLPGRVWRFYLSTGWRGVFHRAWEKLPGQPTHPASAHLPALTLPPAPPCFDPRSALASIIILTHNNLNYTRLCLQSIFQATRHPHYEVIVVDNASTDSTPEYLGSLAVEQPRLRVVRSARNLGFAGGNNLGAQQAKGEVLVFLNNDTVVTEGWLSGLLRHLTHPRVGLVGPVTNGSWNESRLPVSYRNLDELQVFAREQAQKFAGELFRIPVLLFFCVALRREVFDQVGAFDEQFEIGMFEDDDYSRRVRAQGLEVACARDVFVHHWGGATFAQLSRRRFWRLYHQNRRKFERKWGER